MSQENLISTTINPEILVEINRNIDSINASLSNALLFNLTPGERQSLRIMGDKTLAFTQKSLEYAEDNPALVPTYLEVQEAKKDFVLSRDLYTILQRVNVLQRAIEDAMMVAGSEAYDAALIFYNSVKGASRVNVPGTAAIYVDLQQRFVQKPQKAVLK